MALILGFNHLVDRFFDKRTNSGRLAYVVFALICLFISFYFTSCNLVKKSTSTRQQTTDSTAIHKSDSLLVRSSSSSQSDAENWWKLYAMDRGSQPAPAAPGEKTVYLPGQTIYMPGQPYLLAEGGSKNSSSNQNAAESIHVIKVDSNAIYRQALEAEKNKSKSSFPWYWFVAGGVVLLALGFLLPQFKIARK